MSSKRWINSMWESSVPVWKSSGIERNPSSEHRQSRRDARIGEPIEGIRHGVQR